MKHGRLWGIHMFSWWKAREGRVSCTVRLPLKGNIVLSTEQFLFFIYSLEDLCYVAERSKCIDTGSIWFIIYLKDSTSLIFDISFKGLINGIKLFCERALLDFLPLKKDNCNSRTSAHSLFLQKIVLYRVLSRLASSGFLTLIISIRENINVFTEMHNRTLNYVISLSTSTAPGIS